jgi:hypothetical protein
MIHNDEATLVTLTASGATVTRTETPVWCTKKSVSYKEFYAAVEVGINPTYIFEIDKDEYDRAVIIETGGTKKRPTELIYQGEKFNILRTYETTTATIEVTVGL